jgi:formate dehydrogenase iron-sulfur subunit
VAEQVGFFTDTTVCIGCKACQVACKQWNDLPAELEPKAESWPDGTRRALPLTGNSYDNTRGLSDVNWRHVKFIEQFSTDIHREGQAAWLMMSDVCKHCHDAPCLDVCPTQAIIRTEFDTVYINQPTCNGCRDCIAACPFGVIHMSDKGLAQKCTFCYDRLKQNRTPACAQACPTESIRFGPLNKLRKDAETRVAQLQQQGVKNAFLYGADPSILGGLNAFYLLVDKPEVYGLPSNPQVPSRSVPHSALWAIFTSLLTALGVLFAFRTRANGKLPHESAPPKPALPPESNPETSSAAESIHGHMASTEAADKLPPESIHAPKVEPMPPPKPEGKRGKKGKHSGKDKPGEGKS